MKRLTAIVAMVSAASVLAGCGLLAGAPIERPEADKLGGWSALPLPADPALSAIAVGENGPCRFGEQTEPDVGATQVLIQDRRTRDSAFFLAQNAKHFGSCSVTRSSGSSGAGWGDPLEPMTSQLTIDDQAGGTLGDGVAAELGGRIAVLADKVVVRLDDGRDVPASVVNGFWLAWWPSPPNAVRVDALDALGVVVATAEVKS